MRVMKVSSDGLAMWREFRMRGLLRGSRIGAKDNVLVVAQWIDRGRGGLLP